MRHLGILALFGHFGSVVFILLKWGHDFHQTVSDQVSSGIRRTVYVPTTVLSMSAFTVFALRWFLPELSAHPVAYVSASISYMLYMATTFVPRVPGRVMFHDATAMLAGFFVLVLFGSLAMSSTIDGAFRWMLWATVLAGIWLGYLGTDRDRRYYTVLQTVIMSIILFNFLVVTYIVID